MGCETKKKHCSVKSAVGLGAKNVQIANFQNHQPYTHMSILEINEHKKQSDRIRFESMHFQRRLGGLLPKNSDEHLTRASLIHGASGAFLPKSRHQLPPLSDDEHADTELKEEVEIRKTKARKKKRKKEKKRDSLDEYDDPDRHVVENGNYEPIIARIETKEGVSAGSTISQSNSVPNAEIFGFNSIIDEAMGRRRRRRANVQQTELEEQSATAIVNENPVDQEHFKGYSKEDRVMEVEQRKPSRNRRKERKRKIEMQNIQHLEEESLRDMIEDERQTKIEKESEEIQPHFDQQENSQNSENEREEKEVEVEEEEEEYNTDHGKRGEIDGSEEIQEKHIQQERLLPPANDDFEEHEGWARRSQTEQSEQLATSDGKPLIISPSIHRDHRLVHSLKIWAASTFKLSIGNTSIPLSSKTSSERLPLFPKTLRFNHEDMERSTLSIRIHRTDILGHDPKVVHPSVKITILDPTTGNLLRKKGALSDALANEGGNGDYIMPTVTKPYDMRRTKNVIPAWEEEILFDHDHSNFLKGNVVVVFEIIDFGSSGTQGNAGHRVAWAFVRGVSSCGRSLTERNLRLQLYKYPETGVLGRVSRMVQSAIEWSQQRIDVIRNQTSGSSAARKSVAERTTRPIHFAQSDAFKLLSARNRKKYPSSIYVTMRAVRRPSVINIPFSHQAEMLKESDQPIPRGNDSGKMDEKDEENQREIQKKELQRQHWRLKKSQRRRGNREPCIIPRKQLFQLETGAKGCILAKFSQSGDYLACVCCDASHSSSVIKLFDMLDGSLVCCFTGHFGLVYDLDWNCGDLCLSSASSDGSAKVWDVGAVIQNWENTAFAEDSSQTYLQRRDCIFTFHHPTFVYTAKFHPTYPNILITGAYDRKIRVWDLDSGNCIHTIIGHKARITWIEFEPEGKRMYTADGGGVICVWSASMFSSAGGVNPFTQIKYIEESELTASSITCIRVDPRYPLEQLLVHSQDNVIRLLDLTTKKIKSRHSGIKCYMNAQKSKFSPDGRLVVCGSDNGRCYFWNTDNAELDNREGHCFGFSDQSTIYDVEWNYRDHMVAICSYGSPEPVRVFVYENKEKDILHAARDSASLLPSPWKRLFSQQPGFRHHHPMPGEEMSESATLSLGLPISPIPVPDTDPGDRTADEMTSKHNLIQSPTASLSLRRVSNR